MRCGYTPNKEWGCNACKSVVVKKNCGILTQGTESSDFSLISDFFPAPRTILEISVNLKRSFLGGGGIGFGVLHTPQKAFECTICGTRIQKFPGGGPPDPLQETFSFDNSSASAIEIWHYALFRLFWQNPFWHLFTYKLFTIGVE